MSVLRRAKLRTPDGIESIEYPLGVDAENVEVANGENLSQRLARIDEDLEKNEEDIAAVSELAGTNKQNIGANEIRIDALERRSMSVDKKPYYFNTVADMKAYQGLKEGDMAITLGYYEANDGGSGFYKIVNDSQLVDDGGSIHNLSNGLKAELIIKDTITPEQFGAYGDGIHDDSSAIQAVINNFNNILFLEKTYLLESPIIINNISSLNIMGINNNSKIKINSNIYAFEFESLKDKTIENLFFDINNGGGILKTNNSELDFDLTIRNINGEIRTSNNEIIKIVNMHHLKIENCYLVNRSSSYNPTALNLDGVVNGTINKNNFSYFEKGIHITNNSGFTNEGLIISENLFYQNKNQIISDNSNTILFYDINNNVFDYCETYGIKLQNVESSIISNNYFGINNENCICIYIRQINNTHTDLSINENKFINYLQTMNNPFIKINDVGDNIQNGLKIIGNSVTGFITFAELNEINYGSILNNTSQTTISPNDFITGNSINNINYDNNQNGGGAKYIHSILNKNRNIYPEYEDVKTEITHNTFFKPSNANGFYLYITFANSSQETQLINLILSKTGVDNLLIGNQSIAPNAIYENFSIFVPAGYSFKYNTANPSNVIVQNAHIIY